MTARNCRTWGGTQVGSCRAFSAQPTTWPRLLAPVAKPLLPPSVGNALITPQVQTNPTQVGPVAVAPGQKAEQLQFSPRGSGVAVCEIPAMMPMLFFTGQATLLLGPPSVPRSNCEP